MQLFYEYEWLVHSLNPLILKTAFGITLVSEIKSLLERKEEDRRHDTTKEGKREEGGNQENHQSSSS